MSDNESFVDSFHPRTNHGRFPSKSIVIVIVRLQIGAMLLVFFFLLDNLIMARKREGGKRERKWQRFGGGRFCGLEIGGSHCDSLVEREEEKEEKEEEKKWNGSHGYFRGGHS